MYTEPAFVTQRQDILSVDLGYQWAIQRAVITAWGWGSYSELYYKTNGQKRESQNAAHAQRTDKPQEILHFTPDRWFQSQRRDKGWHDAPHYAPVSGPASPNHVFLISWSSSLIECDRNNFVRPWALTWNWKRSSGEVRVSHILRYAAESLSLFILCINILDFTCDWLIRNNTGILLDYRWSGADAKSNKQPQRHLAVSLSWHLKDAHAAEEENTLNHSCWSKCIIDDINLKCYISSNVSDVSLPQTWQQLNLYRMS